MWLCNCGLTVANASHCPLCKCSSQTIEPFESYDEFDALIFKCRDFALIKILGYLAVNTVYAMENPVTPQEELFSKFFNEERMLIKDMDILTMRAHREEMALIAFEARARLTAIDEDERERNAKSRKEKGTTGFARSVNDDDLASEAINKIKERGKRLSKVEKMIEQFVGMGFERSEAEKLVSARTVKDHLENKRDNFRVEDLKTKPESESEDLTSDKPFVNPFDKAKGIVPASQEVHINEETNTVIITKTEEIKEEPYNPFKGLTSKG